MDLFRTRFSKLLSKYNNDKIESYTPYIITLKSKELLKYINSTHNSIDTKIDLLNEYNDTLLFVVKECYNQFNPTLIYAFNDEIHIGFYNVSDNSLMFNGNVHKTLTHMSSFVTHLFTKTLDLPLFFTFTAEIIQFEVDHEMLNYFILRQYDCINNNITRLYKTIDHNGDHTNISLDLILENLEKFIKLESNYILYGNIVKKEIIYVENKHVNQDNFNYKKQDLLTKKVFNVSHIKFDRNFKDTFAKYISNEFL